MFCLMDVSGSMDEERKDIAKRFFILLYLFLTRNYERIEVVFIRHHTIAKEVDEDEFFHSRESGGTVVSSALKLMQEIIRERYPLTEWNIYAAQASDGDNWDDDSSSAITCRRASTPNRPIEKITNDRKSRRSSVTTDPPVGRWPTLRRSRPAKAATAVRTGRGSA